MASLMEASYGTFTRFILFKNTRELSRVSLLCLAMQWTLIPATLMVRTSVVTARSVGQQDWVNQTRILRYAKEKTCPHHAFWGKSFLRRPTVELCRTMENLSGVELGHAACFLFLENGECRPRLRADALRNGIKYPDTS